LQFLWRHTERHYERHDEHPVAERTGYSRANASMELNRARALGQVHRESLALTMTMLAERATEC
jgi:hypothetical protein